MRYLVTGATGFIGSRLARRLVEQGHEVVAVVRAPERATELGALGIVLHRGDVTDRASLVEPMRGVDGVFHVAAWYRVGARDASRAWAVNVEGTRNVLETMRELAIPRGVYTSTLAVFGDTGGRLVDETYVAAGPFLSEYDRTKWVAHYEVALPLMRAGLPLVIVQPGVVYGPGDHSLIGDTFARYLKRRMPIAPAGVAYCWGYVDDMVSGHLLAMERGRPGEAYIIAGPPHSLVDAFAIAERITGIRAPRLHPGPRLMRASAVLADIVGRVIPLPDLFRGESLRVSAGATYLGSNAKAVRDLGLQVRPLDAGLRETLEHEMERLAIARPR